MSDTLYTHEKYKSWLQINMPYIKLYGFVAFIIMFGILPWVVGSITLLRWIF